MPRRRLDWIVLSIVVAVLGAAWVGANRVEASAAVAAGGPPSAEIWHPAPDFALATPGGETVRLSDYRGQAVVLNFWATWCPPCRAEIPGMQAASAAYAGSAVVLGVDVQESGQQVGSFMAQHDMTYPVLLDPTAAVSRTYAVRALPTTYFIDERGMITAVETGGLNQPLLFTRIDRLLGR
jgi:cytochrome c biogenesis protein CcmG/thiol:disulfide interchange protein DsbE